MKYNINAYPWARWIKWGVAALVILILVIIAISSYNGLTQADQEVKRTWSQVENVMQARVDKIDNLVAIVKEYDQHEEKVFSEIAAARSVLMSGSGNVEDILNADSALAEATKSVLLIVEDYPDLKASDQFTNLQEAVEGAENRVAVERKRFIDAVQVYNIKVKRFPGSIFARLMGFSPKDYFEADSNATEPYNIDFSTSQ
jgi:LemA protein